MECEGGEKQSGVWRRREAEWSAQAVAGGETGLQSSFTSGAECPSTH